MMAIQKEQTVNKLQNKRSKVKEISELFLPSKFLPPEDMEFVCIINKQGRIEQSIYKNKISISKEKSEMFSMAIQLQNSMQSDFDDEFGQVNYTITERENARFVTIPTHAGILLAKLNKSIDPFVFVNKIIEIMNSSKSSLETRNGVCQ